MSSQMKWEYLKYKIRDVSRGISIKKRKVQEERKSRPDEGVG